MIFVLLLISSTSYVSSDNNPDTQISGQQMQNTSQIGNKEDLPTFQALIDLIKPDKDEDEMSQNNAKRVEKLTVFLSKFKASLDKVNYQAHRFKETIQNRGQNYQDMKQLLKDIYHKMMQDAFDKFGYNS